MHNQSYFAPALVAYSPLPEQLISSGAARTPQEQLVLPASWYLSASHMHTEGFVLHCETLPAT